MSRASLRPSNPVPGKAASAQPALDHPPRDTLKKHEQQQPREALANGLEQRHVEALLHTGCVLLKAAFPEGMVRQAGVEAAQLPLAAISVVQVTPSSSTEARVVLRSDMAAAFVSVDSAVPGAFSDGAFTMLPAVDFTLTFTARNPLTAQQWTDEFTKGLQVRSLRDTYN